MDHADEVLTEQNEEGVWKVQQENYAFLMESTSIEYIKQRRCNVTQIGGLLDAKGYGIAMRKGSILYIFLAVIETEYYKSPSRVHLDYHTNSIVILNSMNQLKQFNLFLTE